MTNRILRFNVLSPCRQIKKPPGSNETFHNSDHATASIKQGTQGVFRGRTMESAGLFAGVDSVAYPNELRGDQLCDPRVGEDHVDLPVGPSPDECQVGR
jgi:hypothetical protein